LGASDAPSLFYNDISNSTAEPAHLHARPPKNSVVSRWLNTDYPVTICTMNVPTGTIIDLDVELVMQNGNVTQIQAVTTAAVGTLYTLYLDVGSGTHNIIPLQMNTTF
jgi:hypothetical protein